MSEPRLLALPSVGADGRCLICRRLPSLRTGWCPCAGDVFAVKKQSPDTGTEALRAALVLEGHKCRPVARMVMDGGRDWWLGELTESLADWPRETHCLHIQTPLKTVVLGVCQADLDQLNVLGYVMSGKHLNQHWVEKLAKTMKARALLHERIDAFLEAAEGCRCRPAKLCVVHRKLPPEKRRVLLAAFKEKRSDDR
jgi:hypothetical protein